MATRKGPFRLVTVNTAPERAKRLIGRLIDALKEDYDITHVDNCESMFIRSSMYQVSHLGRYRPGGTQGD